MKHPIIYTFFFDGYTYHSRHRVSCKICMFTLLFVGNVQRGFSVKLINFYNFDVIYKIPILRNLFFISAALAVCVYAYQSNNVSNYLSTKVTLNRAMTEIIYLALNNVFPFTIMTKIDYVSELIIFSMECTRNIIKLANRL